MERWMTPKVYLNGEFIDESDAYVSAFDRGFLYGDGIFETMRAFNGKVFRAEAHIRRLMDSARELSIQLDMKAGEFAGVLTELLSVNALTEAYVRITVSRGRHSGDLGLLTSFPPTILVQASEYAGYSEEQYAEGMKLAIVESVRHTKSRTGRHKTLNYLENLLARNSAKATGCDEALFLDENACVVECSASNIFFVFDGDLRTPTVEMSLLPGITRAVVIELARWGGAKVVEKKWPLIALLQADEVFLTNSTMGIMPVCEVHGASIGGGVAGPRTIDLAVEYKKEIEKECGTGD